MKILEPKFWVSAIVVLAAAAFLVHLGLWQLERLKWKTALIADIQSQQSVVAKTVPLENLVNDRAGHFKRGYLSGAWVAGKSVRVGPKAQNAGWGYWIITPLALTDGTIVLINRGWVENDRAASVVKETTQGFVTVMGTLRAPDSTGQPIGGDKHLWRVLDVNGIAAAQDIGRVADLALFAEKTEPADNPYLEPAPVAAELRNAHKMYALFWFAMAGLLVLLFLAASMRAED